MPLIAHLAELRRRVFISIIALITGTVVAFLQRDFIFELLKRPGNNPQLYYFELTGMIGPTMKVAMLGGFLIGLPVIVYQVVMFLAPGLSSKEKRGLLFMLPGVAVSFLVGAAFAYFVLIPPVIQFLFEFGSEVATPLVSVGSYMNTVVSLMFWMGLGFELPFAMYLLTRFGIGNPRFFARQRRIWFVLAFVLGAAITPTFDPVNQTVVAVPFIVLYEIGILLSKLARRRPKQEAPLASQDA